MRVFAVRIRWFLLGLMISSLPAWAQAPPDYPSNAPLADSLSHKEEVHWLVFRPASADPVLFELASSDDLRNLSFVAHEGSMTGGGVARYRDGILRRNALQEAMFEIVYPDPSKTYFIELRSVADAATAFTLSPPETRPVAPLSGASSLDVPALETKGDVRYYKFTVPTADPLILRTTSLDDLSLIGLAVHEGSPTGGGVTRLRDTVVKRNAMTEATFEIVYPNPKKTYVLELYDLDADSHGLTLLPFAARPVTTTTGQAVTPGTDLTFKGDVRYIKFNVDSKAPLQIRFQTSDDLSRYGFAVHQGSPTGGGVDRFRAATTDDQVQTEGVYEIVYPDPD
jgi:hypothetical protein